MAGLNLPDDVQLTPEVERSVKNARWLRAADAGLAALAVLYAKEIDNGVARGGDDARAAMFLGPHLTRTLQELGMTPRMRGTVPTTTKQQPSDGAAPKEKDEFSEFAERRRGPRGA